VKNPGGGFSADLAKKLDKAGSGTDMPERTNNSIQASADVPADMKSGSAADAKSGTADMKPADMKSGSAADAKSGSAADMKPADMKSADMKSADMKPADTKAGSAAKPTDTKAADAKVADVKPADVKPADTKAADIKSGSAAKPADTKVADTKPADTKVTTPSPGTSVSTAPKINGTVVISNGTTPKPPVTVPAELKAININLLPNWDRDVEAAGTISFVVKIPGKTETATFVFAYGMEDAKAPADRDAYKKWLADNKLFVSKDDRQKGSAWYLEGTDPQNANKPAFRMVVVYGGKKLICYGSLYKDSTLGDLRDQAIIQAKQICETLTL
jgi:hypothetical protein